MKYVRYMLIIAIFLLLNQAVFAHEFQDKIIFTFDGIAKEYQNVIQDEIIRAGYERDGWQALLLGGTGFIVPHKPISLYITPENTVIFLLYDESTAQKILYKASEDEYGHELAASAEDLYLFHAGEWNFLSEILTDALHAVSSKLGMSYEPLVTMFYHNATKQDFIGMHFFWHTETIQTWPGIFDRFEYLKPIYEIIVESQNRTYSIQGAPSFRYKDLICLTRKKQTLSGQINPSEPILSFLGLTDDRVKAIAAD